MRPLIQYLETLEGFLELPDARDAIAKEFGSEEAVLDGQVNEILRASLTIENMRKQGAFFTSSKLARIAFEMMSGTIDEHSVILDPTCGAGDLLLPAIDLLPQPVNPTAALKAWSHQIVGRDIVPEYARLARLRLTIAAMKKLRLSSVRGCGPVSGQFPAVRTGCAMDKATPYSRATHVLLNPPYVMAPAPETCSWAGGSVNSAAVFLETCLGEILPDTRLVAILPDVLRSGSRYHKWRCMIEQSLKIHEIQVYGKFDRRTDVDVFLLYGARSVSPGHRVITDQWAQKPHQAEKRLQDIFHVTVGSVVDYRDPERGSWHPFLQSRACPPWDEVSEINARRRFQGRVFEPPFVVVRRTSGPQDRQRAVGTIVLGKHVVAVENHLLVLRPKDGKVSTCQKLLRVLKAQETSEWLNQRIRCRHLTVGVLGELPWE